MNWTLILSVFALTAPPSIAYAVTCFLQLRSENAKQISDQHAKVIEMHEIALDEVRDKLAGLQFLQEQQQKEISKLNEREF